MKKNAFVKVSGNLLEKKEVLKWLKKISKEHFLTVCIGGGKQINAAFEEKGWVVKFGPLGRIAKSPEEKKLARDILRKNQTLFQNLMNKRGIDGQVVVPVREIATILCHENGDIMALSVYNGFDKIFILTEEKRREKKEMFLKEITRCFRHIEPGKLDKIEVIGF